ncbi:FG-GAP-like repeat-containing protein [Terrabacter sp. 2YAF2]|uniref:FG-GAP-like repeat-containing protein n=1 Tax=Terrabacter sp. 2YAF2 TaxID=3233026 RepID=UPI003F9AE41E
MKDSSTGGSATMTMAWPARTGSWVLSPNGSDPEQTVKLTRDRGDYNCIDGTLTVYMAQPTATGEVAALSADLTGVCGAAQIRIGDNDPTRAVSVPRAASVYVGALSGTVITRDVTVTNTGDRPWKAGTSKVASYFYPSLFKVVPGGDHCAGVTLVTGQTCTVTVTVTAVNASDWTYSDDLLVPGDSPTTLVVPLSIEGYSPVEPPTAFTVAPGRLSATVSWQAPSTLPGVGYRVYDVTGGGRTLVATAPKSATQVNVPGAGPRRLALVAANGRFAESPDVLLDVPAVTSEVVGNDWHGPAVSFTPDAPPSAGRPLTVERVDLDPSRTRWLRPRPVGSGQSLTVCPVATEQCTAVPGTDNLANPDADFPYEARWLPDGTIAFLRGNSSQLRTLWVVRPDGTGLRKIADVPDHQVLVPAPDGTQVVLRSESGIDALVRVRLSDGSITVISGTDRVDGFTISNRGQLVLVRRDDRYSMAGRRTTTVMNLDGSGAHVLPLPVGDNRAVTFDPTGTQVAFARYTSDFEATMWVAAADGAGARQLSTRIAYWDNPKWSVEDQLAPAASVTVPAYTARSATASIGAADGDDAAGSLSRECRLDAATTWSPCGPTLPLAGLTVGTHTVSARVTDPGGKQSAVVSKSWVVSARGFDGDGISDILAVTSTGSLRFYPGNGNGYVNNSWQIGAGWNIFNTVFSPGDFTGDGNADLLARKPSGALMLYRGNGAGGFSGGGVQIGTGWGMFNTVLSPGDFDGDGNSDLLGRTPRGDLYLYRGNGAGGFIGGGVRIGTGWNMFNTVISAGDFAGDGHPALFGRTPGGALYLYRGNGAGGFNGGGVQVGAGWGIFRTIFSAGDLNGDGHDDIVGIKPDSTFMVYDGSGTGRFTVAGRRAGWGWTFPTVFGVR